MQTADALGTRACNASSTGREPAQASRTRQSSRGSRSESSGRSGTGACCRTSRWSRPCTCDRASTGSGSYCGSGPACSPSWFPTSDSPVGHRPADHSSAGPRSHRDAGRQTLQAPSGTRGASPSAVHRSGRPSGGHLGADLRAGSTLCAPTGSDLDLTPNTGTPSLVPASIAHRSRTRTLQAEGDR